GAPRVRRPAGPRMEGTSVPRLLLALGVAALVAAGALALASRPPGDVGVALVAPSPDPAPTTPAPPDPGATASTSPVPRDAPPVVATRSARLADLPTAAAPTVPPRHLRIPAVGVDAPVGPVGVEPD